MAKAKKVIITCAVTGAIHTPTMSPHGVTSVASDGIFNPRSTFER